MKSWRLIPEYSAPIPEQMALDEVLLNSFIDEHKKNSTTQPLLRFYYASEPCTTLGYFQRKDLPQVSRLCRRITGGGIVHHGKDIIFSIVAHESHDVSFGKVIPSYRKIHEALREGFQLAGVNCSFYDESQGLKSGAECFIHPIASDLRHKKSKLAGGAQKRSHGYFLHQESLQMPAAYERTSLLRALLKGWTAVLGGGIELQPIVPSWLRAAKTLSKMKYETVEFTLKATLEPLCPV